MGSEQFLFLKAPRVNKLIKAAKYRCINSLDSAHGAWRHRYGMKAALNPRFLLDMNDYRLGILLTLITVVMFGFLAIILKFALQFTDSYTVVWCRFSFSFLTLGSLFILKGKSLKSSEKGFPWFALLAGVFLSINYFGYMEGVRLTTPGNAQILIQFAPLLLALLGVFYFKESFGKKQFFGLIISVVGFSLFYFDQLRELKNGLDNFHRGNLFMLIAILGWTMWGFSHKKLVSHHSSHVINLLVYGVGSIVFIPFVRFNDLLGMKLEGGIAIILLGINTVVSYGAIGKALQLIPANKISFMITLNPIITLVFMKLMEPMQWQWLGQEVITGWGYVGAMVLIVGVVLITSKKKEA